LAAENGSAIIRFINLLTGKPTVRLAWCQDEDGKSMSLDKQEKNTIIQDYARHENDTGSPEVQIALLTTRISQLTEHLKVNRHDQSSRRGLLKLVGQRRRHLKYLSQTNPESYRELLQRLGLRR
jgi:small subunit ribosomal protein S15